MRKISLLIAAALVILVLNGCGPEPSSMSVEPLCLHSADKTAVMADAEDVLSQMHFVIDKYDTASGYIRTRPLTGAQAFEFWRKDNIGRFNTAEANLHTIRRIVEMDITENAGRLCIAPTVTVERMSLPTKDVDRPLSMSSVFTRTRGSMQELGLESQQRAGMEWIELGRDSKLESDILRRLDKKL